MRHISDKQDWFYEFRPYIIIGIGITGLLSRSFVSASSGLNLIGFFSCVALLGIGAHILSMRKSYRKSSFMK